MDQTSHSTTDPRFRPKSRRVPSELQQALNRDWRYRYARGLVAAPDTWRDDPCLCRYRLAGEPLAEMAAQGTRRERMEEIAEALAVAAAAGDEVATRVMVQVMLPSLVVVAWGGGLARGCKEGEECDALDTMISTVWLALATGEALRGDAGVWKRLLRDAEYLVLQRPRRRRVREDLAVGRLAVMTCELADLSGRPDGIGVPPVEELLVVVCEAVAEGLSLADAQLLSDLGVAGVPVTEEARADPAQVTSRCIRYRRAAAVRRVRTLTAEAA